MSEPRVDPEPKRPPRHPIPGWKKGLLVFSLLVGAGGLAMTLAGGGEDEVRPGVSPAARERPDASRSLFPDSTPRLPPPGEEGEAGAAEDETSNAFEEWGPPVTRLGFSFFVGFAVAYALRAFLKISLIVAGVLLLALFGLQAAELVVIDWGALGRHYDSFRDWVSRNAGGVKEFLTGQLPSAASAAAGLVLGFRRR